MNKKDNADLLNQAKSTNKILFLVFFSLIFIVSVFTVAFTSLHPEFILATFPLSFFGSVFISNKFLARSYSKDIMDALPPVNELFGSGDQTDQVTFNDDPKIDIGIARYDSKNYYAHHHNNEIHSITYSNLPHNIHYKNDTST